MNSEEILDAAKLDSSSMGEYEKQISTKALLYGLMVGIIVLLAMFIIDFFILKKPDFGKPALLLFMSGTIDLYDGIVRKKKSNIIVGIIMLLFALLFLTLYIGATLV